MIFIEFAIERVKMIQIQIKQFDFSRILYLDVQVENMWAIIRSDLPAESVSEGYGPIKSCEENCNFLFL